MADEIAQNALRLKELNKLIIKAIANSDINQFIELVAEFNHLKKQIRSFAFEHPIVNLNEIKFTEARKIVQTILSGERFPVENALTGSSIDEFLKGELEEYEIEQLGSQLLYSWFSHYENIRDLYEIGALTLSCGKIPENLSTFVNEARHCFTFQQFNAVFALSRTILELCVKDIATRNNLISSDHPNVRQIAARIPDLYNLINLLCDSFAEYNKLRRDLHRVRIKTNSIVHGTRLVNKEEAKVALRDTLQVVHNLYQTETVNQS